MKYVATLDNASHVVEVTGGDGHYRLTVGDEVWEVDARLTAQGILQVVAVTNPLGLGYEQALVGVKTSGSPEQTADVIARWPEADYVVATAGQFDLVVEIVAADRRHLLELTSRLRALPDVVSTETFMYLEMWKQLYDWGSGMPKEEETG